MIHVAILSTTMLLQLARLPKRHKFLGYDILYNHQQKLYLQFNQEAQKDYFANHLPAAGYDFVILAPTASSFMSKGDLQNRDQAFKRFKAAIIQLADSILTKYRPWQVLIMPDPSFALPINCPIKSLLADKGIYCPAPHYINLAHTQSNLPHYFSCFISSLVIDMHETRKLFLKNPEAFPPNEIPRFHPSCPILPSPAPPTPVAINSPECTPDSYEDAPRGRKTEQKSAQSQRPGERGVWNEGVGEGRVWGHCGT